MSDTPRQAPAHAILPPCNPTHTANPLHPLNPHTYLTYSSQDGSYSVSVLGDLHLEPAQMHLFHEARQQLVSAMSQAPDSSQGLDRARVVQLGDLGGYKHRPGQSGWSVLLLFKKAEGVVCSSWVCWHHTTTRRPSLCTWECRGVTRLQESCARMH